MALGIAGFAVVAILFAVRVLADRRARARRGEPDQRWQDRYPYGR